MYSAYYLLTMAGIKIKIAVFKMYFLSHSVEQILIGIGITCNKLRYFYFSKNFSDKKKVIG